MMVGQGLWKWGIQNIQKRQLSKISITLKFDKVTSLIVELTWLKKNVEQDHKTFYRGEVTSCYQFYQLQKAHKNVRQHQAKKGGVQT